MLTPAVSRNRSCGGRDARMPDFLLPDVGEGLISAEIVSWHVSEGDSVALNQAATGK